MFDKKIEFIANEDYVSLKQDYPIPSIINIPDWFKNLKHDFHKQTVKGCMPFLDTLTAGYILKMPQDFYIEHNVTGLDKENAENKGSLQVWGLHRNGEYASESHINLNVVSETHSTDQLKGSPYIAKNKKLPFPKVMNPWTIKTPLGYSCLFVPPLNNSDDRFSIIPGIVDTDSFKTEINFPMVINGDKYESLKTIIKKGTPYVQVIPFKRDRWKMEIKSKTQKEIKKDRLSYHLDIFKNYKNKFWYKKSWK